MVLRIQRSKASLKRTAKVLISTLYFIGRGLFDSLRRAIGMRRNQRLVVLCYHAVPASARDQFSSQMDMVARHARVVQATATPTDDQGDAVAITFDDAFRSVAENAVGALEKRNFPATIFVPAGVLGRAPDWKFESGYDSDKGEEIMTLEELQRLDPSRITLGCHSMTHPRLTDLDESGLKTELIDSRVRLETELGRKIATLAFPYGAHDEKVVEACRRAGYETVFSITPRPTKTTPEFVRGRVTVEPNDSPLEFFLKMQGAYSWMAGASELKASIKRALGRAPSKDERAS